VRTLVSSLPFVTAAVLAAGGLSVAACSELRVANVGDGGATANGSDGGDEASTLDGGALSSLFGFAGNDIHAVGENGTMLHYDGQSWTKAGTTTGAPNDVYAVGVLAEAARGILMHYDGNG
jgi:hypothetical protein